MKLSVEALNSYYGPAHILFDVALEVGDGEVVALLGRNGAGKSTTFRSSGWSGNAPDASSLRAGMFRISRPMQS